MTVQQFIGRKAALAILLGGGAGGFMLLIGGGPIFLVFGSVFGWFAPDIYLSRAGRLRQEAIERSLPDFLDILAVSVRAGLGYRYALRRVAESLGGPVGDEMLTVLRQIELGQDRRDAFLALRDRNDSASLKAFVAAQLQAEELGVPLSEALNDIADDMRRMAGQNARREAQRASPRVSLLVTTLIVPGSMILILLSIYLLGRRRPGGQPLWRIAPVLTDPKDSGGPRPTLPGRGRRTRTTSMRTPAACGQRRPVIWPAILRLRDDGRTPDAAGRTRRGRRRRLARQRLPPDPQRPRGHPADHARLARRGGASRAGRRRDAGGQHRVDRAGRCAGTRSVRSWCATRPTSPASWSWRR